MLFRVGLVTLLLASALVAEVGAAAGRADVAGRAARCSGSSSPPTGSPSCSRCCCRACTQRRARWRRRRWPDLRADDAAGAPDRRRRVGVRVHVHPRRRRRGVRARARRAGGGGGGDRCSTLARRRRLRRALPLRTLIRTLAVNARRLRGDGRAGDAAGDRAAPRRRAASRRRALQLRDLATLHEDVIRGLTSGLITVGRDGRVLTFNSAGGRDPRAQRRRRASGGRSTRSCPGWRRCMRRVGDGALRRGEVTQLGARDGRSERTLGVSVSPLVDSTGAASGASSTSRI